jgi:hypothetical protein
MSKRHFFYTCLIIITFIWLAIGRMPYKFFVLQDQKTINSYDRYLTSQEYLIRKEQEKMAKLKSIPTELKLDTTEALANNFWSRCKFQEALNLFEQIRAGREKARKGYNQKWIDTLSSLAGLYRDANRLEESARCYSEIWILDKTNLSSSDARLTRDQSNLAMIAFIRGDSEKEPKKRQQFFMDCLKHINDAQIIWHRETKPNGATLANLFYLKYLACRELGDKATSKQCHMETKYLAKQLKRPYVLPDS